MSFVNDGEGEQIQLNVPWVTTRLRFANKNNDERYYCTRRYVYLLVRIPRPLIDFRRFAAAEMTVVIISYDLGPNHTPSRWSSPIQSRPGVGLKSFSSHDRRILKIPTSRRKLAKNTRVRVRVRRRTAFTRDATRRHFHRLARQFLLLTPTLLTLTERLTVWQKLNTRELNGNSATRPSSE